MELFSTYLYNTYILYLYNITYIQIIEKYSNKKNSTFRRYMKYSSNVAMLLTLL